MGWYSPVASGPVKGSPSISLGIEAGRVVYCSLYHYFYRNYATLGAVVSVDKKTRFTALPGAVS